MDEARGKEVRFSAYAITKARNRGVSIDEVARVIEEGSYEPRERLGRLWIAYRSVIVYYEERESYHYVRNVSATRRRF